MLLAFSVLYGRTGVALDATDAGAWLSVSIGDTPVNLYGGPPRK